MHSLPILKPGDTVEIIAPASRCSDSRLEKLRDLLLSWQLNCIVEPDIFGRDILCANSDELRFKSLRRALERPETKAIICARGGYGCMRLIPALSQVKPPSRPKLFVGMSDITALNLYFEQQWQWPTIHGALIQDIYSPESIAAMKAILFAEVDQVSYQAKPLNDPAKKNSKLEASVTGGNLCLLQTSIGTSWQMQGQSKFILMEEVGERGYRVDRMLEHLKQANLFKDAAAIILGDFIEGDEPDGTSLIQPVLERFAQLCEIPVVQVAGIGHGRTNLPISLGTKACLQLGNEIELCVSR